MNIFEAGARIKEVRKFRNITQEELAERIDVSPHYVYEIERGLKTMSIYTLANISHALNVSTDYIINGKEFVSDNSLDLLVKKDNLDRLIENVPLKQRNSIYSILKVILQYIK